MSERTDLWAAERRRAAAEMDEEDRRQRARLTLLRRLHVSYRKGWKR